MVSTEMSALGNSSEDRCVRDLSSIGPLLCLRLVTELSKKIRPPQYHIKAHRGAYGKRAGQDHLNRYHVTDPPSRNTTNNQTGIPRILGECRPCLGSSNEMSLIAAGVWLWCSSGHQNCVRPRSKRLLLRWCLTLYFTDTI